MPTAANNATRLHQRAAKCTKLADGSFDQSVETRYRCLAERYFKLAECEEDFLAEREREQDQKGIAG
jgi:hypothetical protein